MEYGNAIFYRSTWGSEWTKALTRKDPIELWDSQVAKFLPKPARRIKLRIFDKKQKGKRGCYCKLNYTGEDEFSLVEMQNGSDRKLYGGFRLDLYRKELEYFNIDSGAVVNGYCWVWVTLENVKD